MSTPFIVPKKSGKLHRETLKRKPCEFEGCQESFMGTGKSKYCMEHRKRKYRKIIDAGKIARQKADEEARNPNQTIDHKYTDSVKVRMTCQLDGCNEEFSVKIIPNVHVYPKYCPAHRNEFKRNLFLTRKK